MNNGIHSTWTTLSWLTELFKPFMFAEGDGGAGGEGGAGGDGGGAGAGGDGDSGAAGAGAGSQPPPPPTNWRDGLPDDIKAHPAFNNFKDVTDLAKSHLQAQEMIGKKGVILPVEGASEEEMNRFFNEIGRPETVEGYKVNQIQMPEGVKIDDNIRADFLKMAHAEGFNNKQINALFKWQVGVEGNKYKIASDEMNTKLDGAENELRQKYGNAYDANFALAEKVVNTFADEKAKEALKEGLGGDSRLIDMMVRIGKSLSEDTLGKGFSPEPMVLDPDSAQKEIVKIRANDKHPYFVPTDPEHKAALARMDDLYKMAYPNKS